MNAIYLHKPDGTATKWSQCGNCGSVVCPGNFDISERCCTCYDCGLPLGKDERTAYYEREKLPKWKWFIVRVLGLSGRIERRDRSMYHRKCEQDRRSKRDAEKLESAELVAEYAGPVYFDGGHGSMGDGYFSDVYELAEWIDDQEFLAEGDNRPQFAFCCTEHPFPIISSDRLIESYCDDMDEDAADRLDGIDELDAACAIFSEANSGVISWYEDRNRKVRIPPARATA